MPLYRRLAQRGFSNYPFKKEAQIVNLREIEARYSASETVNPESLLKKGLIKRSAPVKVLGDGDLTKNLTVAVAAVSASARAKIEKAGGSVVIKGNAASEKQE
jgi:large subunit ribosomal protein L15